MKTNELNMKQFEKMGAENSYKISNLKHRSRKRKMMFFLLFSLMILQGAPSPIMAAEEIIVSPSDPIEKDTGGKDSTIPIKVTIPSTPINVTLPSSIEIAFTGDDINGIISKNLMITNNSKTRTIKLDSIEVKLKDSSWSLVNRTIAGMYLPDYFKELPFNSKKLYLGIHIRDESEGCTKMLCGSRDCGRNGTSCCYDECSPGTHEALTTNIPYQFSDNDKYTIKPNVDPSNSDENSRSISLETMSGGVSSAISGQDLVDIILTFKN